MKNLVRLRSCSASSCHLHVPMRIGTSSCLWVTLEGETPWELCQSTLSVLSLRLFDLIFSCPNGCWKDGYFECSYFWAMVDHLPPIRKQRLAVESPVFLPTSVSWGLS
ncbi:hypothetical protein MANES_02G176550v8 [Manihot esculenta]|uniref:Uncharacterized protein n=1 Tax=Manihot esculenta TaxID=3983 RepID=A0ACB7I8M9_MANES|nr:hypothetical protein MANES_02G176550v8 [Manihot esculenta]